jgi:release factor glutamine methyltransferase
MPEVRQHEPPRALDGGPDGLDAFRAILASLPRLLAPGGSAVLELAGAGPAIAAMAAPLGLELRGFQPDLNGIHRSIVLAAF